MKDSGKLLVIKYPCHMHPLDVERIQKRLAEQKKSGVVLVPYGCDVMFAPYDVEIKIIEQDVSEYIGDSWGKEV